MYRIISVLLLICSVQSEPAKNLTESKCQMNSPTLKVRRNFMKNCFTDVVHAHIHGAVDGQCSNVSEFGESLKSYFGIMVQECKYNFTVPTNKTLQFVNHSLVAYKEFYDDIDCVKRMERNISECVVTKVGSFNITNEKKHSSWYNKIRLTYDGRNCKNARDVKTCTSKVLNSCKNTTRAYIESLFDFSLKNCNDTSANNTISRPVNAAPSAMSKSVLVTVTIISVLIGIIL